MTTCDVWEKMDKEKKQMFNRQYIELANEYFASTCRMGFKNADMVIHAILHAITSSQPKYRYLLVSTTDHFFFQLLPFLPTILTDSIFTFSSIYAKRKEMVYK